MTTTLYTHMPDLTSGPVISRSRCAACGAGHQWHTDDHCDYCGTSVYDQPGGNHFLDGHDPDARTAALQRHAVKAHEDYRLMADEDAAAAA